ncbi:hypothetical protein KC865_04260 [Candidatus Kaiserbacteria bacterium]|nr:hypothetical protein [Candidatus Kaiserbacteria bacterium]USN92535.1 MAG: hypothetical protein H6782_01835 [Candidatus Nomurabacteria bacterium]
MQAKNIVMTILALVLIGSVAYLFIKSSDETMVVKDEPTPTETTEDLSSDSDKEKGEESRPLNEVVIRERGEESSLGFSANGNEIIAYHFGHGANEILFIGGTHGGYSWNTALVGYELVDYLKANPEAIPENVTVTVIPLLNPDGLEATIGKTGKFTSADATGISDETRVAGRFNANEVDLNRNFDCEWKATGTWKDQSVSGGESPFSESEAVAVRDYVETYKPVAAVVWFSSEGKVYPSACKGVPSKDSVTLAATFATAAGYPAEAEFNAYAITGDMVNWMAGQGIPAISVLLSDHNSTEWEKNEAGIEAVIKAYSE